jgi:uncharacterized iron-regulated membrane protein
MTDHPPHTFLGLSPRTWRQWHRWIGFPAALFLLFASTTGFLVAFTEFFGEAERLREANRGKVSRYTTATPPAEYAGGLARALASVPPVGSERPVDKIELQLKADRPTITIYTSRPSGYEDRKFVFDAASGALLKNESYADKPFLWRLHSGEAFGDGGLVAAMAWALALVAMTITGFVIYLRMKPRTAQSGLRRVFW